MSAMTTTAAVGEPLTSTTQQQGSMSMARLVSDEGILKRIFSIVLNTDRKALTACARASHHFYSVATPILYSRVRLATIPPRDSRRDGTGSASEFGPNGDLSKINAKQYNPVIADRKKKLLAHATTVRIDAHYINFCCSEPVDDDQISLTDTSNKKKHSGKSGTGGTIESSTAHHGKDKDDIKIESVNDLHSLKFPKLKTLVIYPTVRSVPEQAGPLFHAEYLHPWRKPKAAQHCSVITNLTKQLTGPKKIVLNTIIVNRFDLFPPGLPKDIYDGIDQLTLVAPMIDFRFTSTDTKTLPSLPNLKKLVLVFKSPEPKVQWKMGTHNMFGWGGLHDFVHEDLRYFTQFLWQLEDPTTQVYIVNSDWLYHLHVGLKKGATSEAVQAAFKKKLFDSLSNHPYKVEFDTGHSWPFSDSESSDDGLTKEQKMNKAMLEEVHALMGGMGAREYKSKKWDQQLEKERERAIRKRDRPERHQREKDDKERLRIKLDNIHFVTMRDYLANHDWEGEIEPEDVIKWRKAEQATCLALGSGKGKAKERSNGKRKQVDIEVEVELGEDGQLIVGPSSSKR
ncbi:hypothetical protein IAU59_005139 [Kwoniella sp. CBS 9459]